MAICPTCGDEYEDGVEVCPDDRTVLVASGDPDALAAAAVPADASLGTFHPRVAVELWRLLERRGTPHGVVEVDPERVELRVPAELREELRAQLVLEWRQLLLVVPPEEAEGFLGVGSDSHPGWYDAPRDSWVDRDGRLRVAGEDDDALADAQRNLGPALAAGGVVLALLGWAQGGSDLLYLLGGVGVVVGLLLPR